MSSNVMRSCRLAHVRRCSSLWSVLWGYMFLTSLPRWYHSALTLACSLHIRPNTIMSISEWYSADGERLGC